MDDVLTRCSVADTESVMNGGFEVKIHRLKTGQFQTVYIDPVKTKKVRNKFATLKDAKTFQVETETHFATTNISSFSNLPVARLMELHLKQCPRSKVIDRKNSFISFCEKFGHYQVGNLTKRELQAWFDQYREQRKCTERNLIRIKSQLNFFMKWLVEENYLQANPLSQIKFKRNVPPKRDRVILSADEIKELLERLKLFSPDVLYPFIYAIIHTGARRSEIMRLKWEDVDFRTGFIHFKNTKNGENRQVRMSAPLQEFLNQHPRKSEWVFNNGWGDQLIRGKVQRLVYSFKERYPTEKDWKCHDLRHSFAYNFLKRGGEMYQLKAILGHKTIQMTVDLYGNLKAVDVENPSPFDF